jgi:triacylglycerol lipase
MRRAIGILIMCLALSAGSLLAVAPALAGATAGAAGHTPVIFVHGFGGSASSWTTTEAVFEAAGYRNDELFTYDYNSYGDNRVNAQGLAALVAQVKASTGAAAVDIVSHSMGSLITLWYLHELGGTASTRRVASLAGANHGTLWAAACLVFLTCRQMLPHSSFDATVTAGDETPGNTTYATWYSPCDGIIIPYTSTELKGAVNTKVPCETHTGYLTDTAVLSQVRAFLSD